MKSCWCLALVICGTLSCQAQSREPTISPEAEYYVAAYAQHYRLPIAFVRAVVTRSRAGVLVRSHQRRSRSHAADAPKPPHVWESGTAAISKRTFQVECATWHG